MRILRLCVLLSAVLAAPFELVAADRRWVEIQSPHFVVICNGSEKEGRDAAVDLERTRTVLMKALPSLRQDPNIPIVVFVTADEDTFATLVPVYKQRAQGNKPASMFQRGRDRNYIVMRIVFRGSAEYQLKYDYTGMMAGINFPRAPLWFVSGFAEFFALSEIEDTKAKVGLPNARYVQRLEKSAIIPLSKLVTVRTNSEEYKDPELRWMFDAESWGLFHYLMLADKGAHRAQLVNYIDLLSHGKKQSEAVQEAFGDLKKLQDTLYFYYAQKAYPIGQLDLTREGYAEQLSARSLPPEESNAWLAEYHLRFKRQAEAKPLIEAALAANPDEPRAREAQGLLYLEQANYESALKEFSAATAHDPPLYLAYYYKGILSSYWKAPDQIPESAERDLRRSLEIAPRYAPAALALARLVARKGGNLAEAVKFARSAAETEPGIPRYELAYANILLLAGDGNQAETQVRQALGNELSPLEEEAANALLQLAQDCKPGAPCKALGHSEFGSAAEAPTAVPASAPAPGTSASDPAAPIYRLRGVIRAVACQPEGRVVTLASGEKDLTFNATKATRFTWPETFWLDGAYLDVCKHFAGEPGAVKYKGADPVAPPADATAVEVQDRF